MPKPKVLHCITAYNGDTIVPRAIASALEIDQTEATIDILILDDCSPAPGFSDRIKALCASLGVNYYRTPRNLGIPRNCSLGLLAALKNGYDFVTINNSDVIFSRNVMNELIRAYRQNDNVGSVTAWSNNVSIYSIPNADPDKYIGDQARANIVGEVCAELYSGQVLDIPAGISFCILIPTKVVADVGINDPIFGRGYCEETDWSLRSLAAGYRICLAPGAFTYHQGRGSNLSAGLVTGEQTSVPENEAIIDLRYPAFRQQCDAFISNNPLRQMHAQLSHAMVERGLNDHGYRIDISHADREDAGLSMATLTLRPELTGGTGSLSYMGFADTVHIHPADLKGSILRRCRTAPHSVNSYDRSELPAKLSDAFQIAPAQKKSNYPSLV